MITLNLNISTFFLSPGSECKTGLGISYKGVIVPHDCCRFNDDLKNKHWNDGKSEEKNIRDYPVRYTICSHNQLEINVQHLKSS